MGEVVRRTVYRSEGDGRGQEEKSVVSSKLANQVYIVRQFCCSRVPGHNSCVICDLNLGVYACQIRGDEGNRRFDPTVGMFER